MKKILSLVMISLFLLCTRTTWAYANQQDQTYPKNMPEAYLAVCSVESTKTDGVTFVLTEMFYHENVLHMSVLQLPNNDHISLFDNQVDYGSETTARDREVDIASEYGSEIVGTFCDIASITDKEGNNLIDQYRVSEDRKGSSLSNQFSIYFLPQDTEINVELHFGVFEDIDSRYAIDGTICMNIPSLESLCDKQDLL